MAPAVWRALFARRLRRSGLTVAAAGLDFWELTLLSLIEEEYHGPEPERYEEL